MIEFARQGPAACDCVCECPCGCCGDVELTDVTITITDMQTGDCDGCEQIRREEGGGDVTIRPID